MSRGPGWVEQRVGELFAATRNRALSVADLCDHVFRLAGTPASRSQRISVLRAARACIRRRPSWPFWRITEAKDGRLYFRPDNFPVRVWAVELTPDGLIWSEAEIVSITAGRVNVRHNGE